jgi:hypothetical protein
MAYISLRNYFCSDIMNMILDYQKIPYHVVKWKHDIINYNIAIRIFDINNLRNQYPNKSLKFILKYLFSEKSHPYFSIKTTQMTDPIDQYINYFNCIY